MTIYQLNVSRISSHSIYSSELHFGILSAILYEEFHFKSSTTIAMHEEKVIPQGCSTF